MTFPDTVPAWMSETPPVPDCPPPSYVKAPPLPAWCRGAGETEYTSYLPRTGANLVELASPMVRINDDLSLHLSQTEEWFCEDITHTPLRVMLWARDGGLPFHLTASEAQALGLALIEHAVVGALWRVSDDLSAP